MTAEEWLNGNELSVNIFNKKYRNDGESLEEFFERVGHGYSPIIKLIKEKKFLFGGRILANRGVSGRNVSLSNCYVLPRPEDNLESIFDIASKMARTFSYGGGVGIDLSNLRPKGAVTHNAAKESTGPVSFMDLYSQVTQTISQAGRRGATMISLDINHPDIEEFINCKTDLDRVKYANISVRVNDDFMKAVENNEDYILKWPCDVDVHTDVNVLEYNKLVSIAEGKAYIKKVKAKELFTKLAKNNWDYAEPGMLFWSRISNYNLLNNTDFRYAGTNPCAEEPLPAFGACLLGSLNLSEFVLNPFTKKAKLDFEALEKAVFTCIVALNQCLLEGIEMHPLQEQKDMASNYRQIGLGTLGLGDMLIKLGIKYGSEESCKFIEEVYKDIAKSAVLQSLELAKAHGCYAKCEKEKLVESSFIKALELPKAVIDEIKEFGLYNSQLLTCAPTGTIGTMLCTSTGVEPNFAFNYTRRTVSLDGKDTYYSVDAKIVQDYKNITGNTELPDYFVSSADIAPIDRIKVQEALQKYTDASISSTINLPKETTVEEVYDIYLNAWKHNLKGVTIYRSGCKREGILTTDIPKPEDIIVSKAPKRPKDLPADLHLVKVKGEQFIVLVGLYNDKPYEIFTFRPNIKLGIENHRGVITKKSKMHYMFKSDLIQITELELANENLEEKAATLYASMLLRHGVDIKYIIKTAKKVNDNISSFTSAMCRILSKYMPNESLTEKCPECGGELIRESGCIHCKSCGWSRCS